MVDVNVNFVLGNDEPLRADFELQPDVTYTADIKLSEATRDHTKLYNRDRADQHPMSAITGLEDALDGLSDDITAENNRAVEAEETLDNKIDSEIDTRADEITRVEGLISDEETRAEGVEGGLREDLTAEINRATNAEGVLQTNITAEENRAKGVEQQLTSSIDSNHQAISNHVSDKNNPHEVTKAQVGLGNVENLAPADMPMSTATKTYVDNADNGLQGQITTINTTIGGYGNIVTHNVSEFATASQGALADTALQPSDNISELTNNLNYQTATQVANSIAVETNNRESADNNLQSQIDAIVSASDVFDIVGTYAELQAYDISTVPVNDIIKVLEDSTHGGAATYYRCIETNNVKSWSYIGSEGAYYTKGEADNKFVPQTRTVNSKALSSDITLTASDVGALPDNTVIPTVNDATVTIQKNGSTVSTFTLNQSSNETVNITVPTDTGDLTNGAGFITGITSGDVTTALGYTPVNPSSLATVATSGDYDDLTNKPTIPTVGDGTITITQGGVTKGTFTTNQSGNTTIALDQGGTVDQTYDGTSTNAQSGVAIEGELSTNYQSKLVSGTNIKTINNTSLLGGGNLSISADNIFWATYGTTTYADMLSAINDGKLVLCTYSGSTYYYDGSGGGYISFTTNTVGTNYVITVDSSDNWTNDSRTFPTVDQTYDGTSSNAQSGVAVAQAISGVSVSTDGTTISKNSDNELQAIGTVNKNTAVGATAVKYDWIGTLAEYNAQNVESLHPEWICYITDDVSGGTSVYTKAEVDSAISTALTTMLDSAFPVGSRYITEASTCPLATLIPNSTWVLTSQGRVLQGADSNHASGTTAEAGLPNIQYNTTKWFGGKADDALSTDGALRFEQTATLGVNVGTNVQLGSEKFNASWSNSIYGNSTTVQPPAEFVNIFKRTA